jgi:hypothetical protein
MLEELAIVDYLQANWYVQLIKLSPTLQVLRLTNCTTVSPTDLGSVGMLLQRFRRLRCIYGIQRLLTSEAYAVAQKIEHVAAVLVGAR